MVRLLAASVSRPSGVLESAGAADEGEHDAGEAVKWGLGLAKENAHGGATGRPPSAGMRGRRRSQRPVRSKRPTAWA